MQGGSPAALAQLWQGMHYREEAFKGRRRQSPGLKMLVQQGLRSQQALREVKDSPGGFSHLSGRAGERHSPPRRCYLRGQPRVPAAGR